MNDVCYRAVSTEEEGQRLDNYLIRVLKGVPKSHVYRIIRSGEVRVNKKRASVHLRLQTGDQIRIPPIRMTEEKKNKGGAHLLACLLNGILYEDEQLLVINKPAGIAVHGGSGLSMGVIETLRYGRPDLSYLELVHRLDKETSGCLLLSKKRSVLRSIQALLEERQVKKIYWALLCHPWKGKKVVEVDMPLQKNILKSGERLVCVSENGKASQTTFKLLENYSHTCWIEASPRTGRTHQIRVHSAYLGHPILGDDKYNKGFSLPTIITPKQRLYLHARSIQFNLNGKNHVFQADFDSQFKTILEQLRGEVG